MSYKIEIQGHSSKPHNDLVKQVAEGAVAKLREADPEATVTLGGYSNDGEGSITLTTPEKG